MSYETEPYDPMLVEAIFEREPDAAVEPIVPRPRRSSKSIFGLIVQNTPGVVTAALACCLCAIFLVVWIAWMLFKDASCWMERYNWRSRRANFACTGVLLFAALVLVYNILFAIYSGAFDRAVR
jgi:hypothetical protein